MPACRAASSREDPSSTRASASMRRAARASRQRAASRRKSPAPSSRRVIPTVMAPPPIGYTADQPRQAPRGSERDDTSAIRAVGIRPYRKANHGAYVAFAAPGVDVPAGTTSRTGTSYAAAFVTAAVAETVLRGLAQGPPAIERRLAAAALDLGPPGRDPVFGWGLVRFPDGCATPS